MELLGSTWSIMVSGPPMLSWTTHRLTCGVGLETCGPGAVKHHTRMRLACGPAVRQEPKSEEVCKLCGLAGHVADLPAQYVERYRAPAGVTLTGFVSACRDQLVLPPMFAGLAQGRESLRAAQLQRPPRPQQKCS
jgi:hypothetical protein